MLSRHHLPCASYALAPNKKRPRQYYCCSTACSVLRRATVVPTKATCRHAICPWRLRHPRCSNRSLGPVLSRAVALKCVSSNLSLGHRYTAVPWFDELVEDGSVPKSRLLKALWDKSLGKMSMSFADADTIKVNTTSATPGTIVCFAVLLLLHPPSPIFPSRRSFPVPVPFFLGWWFLRDCVHMRVACLLDSFGS